MIRKKNKGFTLVELLAVIVILAIILVIAVPKVMNVIKDTTKASLESSAKMIAAQVENQCTVAQTLGKEFGNTGSCMEEWAGLNETDYASCTYEVTSEGNATVSIEGKGKFKGLSVCNATRSSATAIEGECPFVCFGYESTIEKIDVTIPYVVKDVDSCINYFNENFLEYWYILTEDGIRALCNGNSIYDDPDYYNISSVISYLKDDNVLTEKELIENNVIEGNITNVAVCLPNTPTPVVSYVNNLYNNNFLRDTFSLIKDNTDDENIRYVGRYVQNYVEFGNAGELWRIIGTFEVETADGETEELVKIVKDEPFKDSDGNILWMSWDSSANDVNNGKGINQWGESGSYEGADLMRMLNEYYIGKSTSCTYCNGWNQSACTNSCNNSITPINSTYRNMIENVVWSTRGIEDGSYTVKEMYEAEKTSLLTGKECTSSGTQYDHCNDTVERTTEWEGKIGLIYASDWGYASTDTDCEDITKGNGTCYQSNWLTFKYVGDCTISPTTRDYSGEANKVWSVDVNSEGDFAGAAYKVRPSLYLKSNVKIIGGDGSENNPYKLAI